MYEQLHAREDLHQFLYVLSKGNLYFSFSYFFSEESVAIAIVEIL